MLWNECARRMRRSIFWIMAVLIGILLFISMFSQIQSNFLWSLEEIIEGNTIGLSLINCERTTFPWGSFVSYAIPSCCVCAVAGGAMEDIECNRYNYMLPRSGCIKYAVCNIAGISIVSFLCVMMGCIIYYGAALFVVKIPLTDADIDMMEYPILLFILLRVLVTSLFGVFMTLLAMTLALWIHDRNIVVILPAIFMYFFYYMLDRADIISEEWFLKLKLFSPKYIYMNDGTWRGDYLGWCEYAAAFTFLIAALATAILYVRIRRWRKA